MTTDDLPAFHRALKDVANTFGTKMPDTRVDHYWTALRDLSLRAFGSACLTAIRSAGTSECRFFPLPGLLRDLAASFTRANSDPITCSHCQGTGLITADPDMELVHRLYGQDATAAGAQPTVTRCECRS